MSGGMAAKAVSGKLSDVRASGTARKSWPQRTCEAAPLLQARPPVRQAGVGRLWTGE